MRVEHPPVVEPVRLGELEQAEGPIVGGVEDHRDAEVEHLREAIIPQTRRPCDPSGPCSGRPRALLDLATMFSRQVLVPGTCLAPQLLEVLIPLSAEGAFIEPSSFSQPPLRVGCLHGGALPDDRRTVVDERKEPMTNRMKKVLAAVGLLAVFALGGSAVASALSNDNGTTQGDIASSTATDTPVQRDDEQPLTGDTATKVEQAALAKTGGGTVERVETDADGNAAYEAHVVKSDGTRVTVYVDEQFNVVGVEEADDREDHDGPDDREAHVDQDAEGDG